MSNVFGGGSNLPPGCSVNDLPGNSPEDEAWEEIYNEFFNKDRLLHPKTRIRITEVGYKLMDKLYDNPKYSAIIDDYIMAAIEYGINIGTQGQINEYKVYENEVLQYNRECKLPKLRTYFKKQRELKKELVEALQELLDEFNTVTSMYEGGSIDRVRELAENALSKAED